MEWVKERDLLIAQTMAFVRSVSEKKRDAWKPDAEPDIRSRIERPRIEAAPLDAIKFVEPADSVQFNLQVPLIQASPIQASPIQISPIQVPRPRISGDVRTEIQNRVATFRAHQERFHREREAYFCATLARARDATRNDSGPLR
jgi:hypothetical protein